MYRKIDVDRVDSEARDFVAMNDRLAYSECLAAIEKYVDGNTKVLVGYRGKYMAADTMPETEAEKLVEYEVLEIWYSGPNTFEFVKGIADNLYVSANNKFIPRDTIMLQTSIKNREYNLHIFARQIAHIMDVGMLQQRCIFPLMKPISVSAVFAENTTLSVAPPLILASDIYADLYNPVKIGDLARNLVIEGKIFAEISRTYGDKKKIGGDGNGRDDGDGDWEFAKFDDSDEIDAFAADFSDPIMTGGGKDRNKKRHNDKQPEIHIDVREFLAAMPGSVLVGADAMTQISDIAIRQAFPTILTSEDPDVIEKWITDHTGESVYRMTMRTFSLNDFRMIKIKYYVGERGANTGLNRAVLETYNSTSYELIPIIETDIGRVGAPQVIARFAAISMWVSSLDGKPMRPRYDLYAAARNLWHNVMFAESYPLDAEMYSGAYSNPSIARKKMTTSKLPPYYPVQNVKNGKNADAGDNADVD